MRASPSKLSGYYSYICIIFSLFVNLSQGQIFTFLNYVNDAQGGCAIERANGALLRNYQESQTLIQAGLQAINNYGVDPEARRLVAAYFGIRPDIGGLGFSRPAATYNEYWTTVQEYMNAVQNFLNGQLASIPVLNNVRPYIFCNSNWLQPYNWNDQALDGNGQPIFDIGANGEEVPVPFSEAYPGYYDQYITGNEVRYPQWAYLFNVPYFAPYQGDYCSGNPDDWGFTLGNNFPAPSSVTICPSAYNAVNHIATLGGTGRPAIGTSLDSLLPYSATYFHELFHLANGNADTDDIYEDVADVIAAGLLPNEQDGLTIDPEVYILFCLAYYYTLNSGAPRISFQDGTAQLA